jgi:hypothetical protein
MPRCRNRSARVDVREKPTLVSLRARSLPERSSSLYNVILTVCVAGTTHRTRRASL